MGLPLSVVHSLRETSLEKNCFPQILNPPTCLSSVEITDIYIIVMAHHETNYLKPKFYLLLHMMSECEHVYHGVHAKVRGQTLGGVFSFHLLCGFSASNSDHEVYAASTFMLCTIALSQFLAYQRKTSTERKGRREWASGVERINE